MTPLGRVLAELEARGAAPRRSGEGWSARCPAHDDHDPSLSVSEGRDGRALLRCAAGCEWKAVTAALGLVPAELFPLRDGGNGRPQRRIVAKYDYRDAAGELLYQAVRFEPKDF